MGFTMTDQIVFGRQKNQAGVTIYNVRQAPGERFLHLEGVVRGKQSGKEFKVVGRPTKATGGLKPYNWYRV